MSRTNRLALRGPGPPGPKVGAEPGLQPGDGREVRPHPSGQDISDGRVIDASERFRRSQAAPGQGIPQPEGKEPCDFGGGVVTGNLRPIGAMRRRGKPDGSRHSTNVDPSVVDLVVPTSETVTPSWQTVGTYHRQDELSAVARSIEHFTPDIPERYWAVIGSFVRAAVADAQPSTVYSAHDLLSTTARHVLWCWQTAGLELGRKIVFERWVIEEYIMKGCPTLSPASRGNRRSQLLRISEALLGPDIAPGRLTPLPASDPVRPYSPSEIVALRSWAEGQSTPTRRRDAATLLALGAGAGLAVEDIAGLTAGMVTVDDMGVLLAVPGRRSRLAPVLAEWEPPLIEAARSIPSDRLLFGEVRRTGNKNFVSNFVNKSSGVGPKPSVQRLRATWLVHHLTARSAVVPFMAAAGVGSLEALTRYLRYVPDTDPAEARRVLRGLVRDGAGK